MGYDYRTMSNEDIDEEYHATLAFVPQLGESTDVFPGRLTLPDHVGDRPVVSLRLRRNAISPVEIEVDDDEDLYDIPTNPHLSAEMRTAAQHQITFLTGMSHSLMTSGTRETRMKPSSHRGKKSGPRTSKAIPKVAVSSTASSLSETFQSITASDESSHLSFEELRLECYAYARTVKGEMDRPKPFAPDAPAAEVYPPIFVPFVRELEERAGGEEVDMADSGTFEFAFGVDMFPGKVLEGIDRQG